MKNLAVVEAAEVAFGPGLNVITGETGAGKSVLMGALHLLLGARAERGMIRSGASEAMVCGEFSVAAGSVVEGVLAEAGVEPCEGGVLVIRRVISEGGTGRIRVNDCAATAGLLRQLAPHLADIHGPNDNVSLLDEGFQLRLLTGYAGAAEELTGYAGAWRRVRELEGQLADLAGAPGERAEEVAQLEEELAVYREVEPTEADGEELVARHAEAANAEAILAMGNALTEALTDGEQAISEQLMGLQRGLRELGRLLPEAGEWGRELSGVQVQVQALSQALAERLSRVEAEPEALAQLEERLAQIQRLRRRYGPTLADVLQHRVKVEERLAQLRGAEGEIARMEEALAAAREALLVAGMTLRRRRMAGVTRLAAAITGELRELGFREAAFGVEMRPCEPGPMGMDGVCFTFAPNLGESARPLAAIASSGEVARVMLAVKGILAAHDAIPTLVFDEIDANIGGETARKVGEKLRRLGRQVQVLCVTHQPQAAVFGEAHFRVEKGIEAGRTVTRIVPLAEVERVAEVARMLGGGEAARVHAQALCQEAHQRDVD